MENWIACMLRRRTRLFIARRHRKYEFMLVLKAEIEQIAGVEKVQVEPISGSILIHHLEDQNPIDQLVLIFLQFGLELDVTCALGCNSRRRLQHSVVGQIHELLVTQVINAGIDYVGLTLLRISYQLFRLCFLLKTKGVSAAFEHLKRLFLDLSIDAGIVLVIAAL